MILYRVKSLLICRVVANTQDDRSSGQAVTTQLSKTLQKHRIMRQAYAPSDCDTIIIASIAHKMKNKFIIYPIIVKQGKSKF